MRLLLKKSLLTLPKPSRRHRPQPCGIIPWGRPGSRASALQARSTATRLVILLLVPVNVAAMARLTSAIAQHDWTACAASLAIATASIAFYLWASSPQRSLPTAPPEEA